MFCIEGADGLAPPGLRKHVSSYIEFALTALDLSVVLYEFDILH